MNWIITGDCHGQFSRFKSLGNMSNTAVIILGDAGINYHLDERDLSAKRYLAKFPFTFYCVRGNHEARPGDVEGMKHIWDDEVEGYVWVEDDFPNIRYFDDWGIYYIDGLRTLVIGGAMEFLAQNNMSRPWEYTDEEWKEKLLHISECFKQYTIDQPCPSYSAWYASVEKEESENGCVTVSGGDPELARAWHEEELHNYNEKMKKLKEGFDLLYEVHSNLWD